MFLQSKTCKTAEVIVLLLLLLLTLGGATNILNTVEGKPEPRTQNLSEVSTNGYVDLTYLGAHMAEFGNQTVTTNGLVGFFFSYYMFEDFWLGTNDSPGIPVVTRLAGLPIPQNGSFIKISGTIEYSTLELGFYYLNAVSYETIVIPEFPSNLVLALSLILFLLSTALLKTNSMKRKTQLRLS